MRRSPRVLAKRQGKGDFIRYRTPENRDGGLMWALAQGSNELDENSAYTYLLFAHHFPNTCTIAEAEGEPVGFVLGFRPPEQPDTLFVWQIGVAPSHRGQGIGVEMLASIVERHDGEVRYVDATVTPSNAASRKMFESFARRQRAPFESTLAPLFSHDMFPDGGHEDEHHIRIGPIRVEATEMASAASPLTA